MSPIWLSIEGARFEAMIIVNERKKSGSPDSRDAIFYQVSEPTTTLLTLQIDDPLTDGLSSERYLLISLPSC